MTDREKFLWMIGNSAMAVEAIAFPVGPPVSVSATKTAKPRAVMVATGGKSQREIVAALVKTTRKAGLLRETPRSRRIK